MGKLILSYLKKERNDIWAYLGCIGIFCTVLFLYNADMEGIGYAAVLSGVFMLGLLFKGLIRYLRHYEQTAAALSAIPYELRELPESEEETEALYQTKIQEQQAYTGEMESGMRISRRDMMDYYSLWTHQIKTPIAAMRLLIQEQEGMEPEGIGSGSSEDTRGGECAERKEEFLRSLKMEVFKTEQYVEMALSYLRMEEMSSDLTLQWYPVDGIVRQAVKKYSQLFIMKKIRLEYRKCEGMALTDEKWMVFVLEQILSNALKYTKNGTISIYQEDGEDGRLVIEDTGIGIQAEDLPRIFEKGFTGYNGRQDKKSTGIGLYLCKTICEKLDHTITMESEVGKGSRVYLDLHRRLTVL